MFKRMFSRKQPKNVTKSIRCPQVMWDAIELLANEMGETPNAYVVGMLDEVLQKKVKEGRLQAPTGTRAA